MYGKTVGEQINRSIQSLGGSNPNVDYYTRVHRKSKQPFTATRL